MFYEVHWLIFPKIIVWSTDRLKPEPRSPQCWPLQHRSLLMTCHWRTVPLVWLFGHLYLSGNTLARSCQKDKRTRKRALGASLVAQWWRICLLMQETRIDPWSGKIPRAVEWLSPCATLTEPVLSQSWVHMPQLWKPSSASREATAMRSHLQLESSLCSLQLEKSPCSNEDPKQPHPHQNCFLIHKIIV